MASNDPISGQHPLAVLIDADNTTPSKIGGLLAEIAKYGVASVKRIYGDWTKPNLGGWKDELLNHSIQPVQQFAYTKGKNATDIAMIIDAMDLLYTQRFRGFCLVTSDSDFTPLAARIREQGLIVYGFGEEKTPAPFRNACDKFVFLHLLETPDDDDGAAPPERKSTKELRQDGKLIRLVDDAIASSSDDSDWATLSHVGQYMNKQSPEFDPRNYGYGKLSALIDAIGLYETDRSRGHHPAIRRKARK